MNQVLPAVCIRRHASVIALDKRKPTSVLPQLQGNEGALEIAASTAVMQSAFSSQYVVLKAVIMVQFMRPPLCGGELRIAKMDRMGDPILTSDGPDPSRGDDRVHLKGA
jgi:hypothetical protein